MLIRCSCALPLELNVHAQNQAVSTYPCSVFKLDAFETAKGKNGKNTTRRRDVRTEIQNVSGTPVHAS